MRKTILELSVELNRDPNNLKEMLGFTEKTANNRLLTYGQEAALKRIDTLEKKEQMMAEIKCTNGHVVPAGQAFCGVCGEKVNQSATPALNRLEDKAAVLALTAAERDGLLIDAINELKMLVATNVSTKKANKVTSWLKEEKPV